MPHETIVVDDASTDRTSRVAREHGTVVLMVHLRQMAATGNAGAKAQNESELAKASLGRSNFEEAAFDDRTCSSYVGQ
jgi:hypothetical protein